MDALARLPRSLAVLAFVLMLPSLSAGQALTGHAAPGWATIFDTDFSRASVPAWPIGTSARYDAHIAEGSYSLQAANHFMRVSFPAHMALVGDGAITASFSMAGNGRVGLAARENRQGTLGYTLWISREGYVGATREAVGYPSDLFVLSSPAVRRTGRNSLTLQISGDTLSFFVNGVLQRRYVDRHALPAGVWGAYADARADKGAATAQYSRITLRGSVVSPAATMLTPGPFVTRVDYDFAAGNDGSWWTNFYPHSNRRVADGRYTLSANGNVWESGSTFDLPSLTDGQVGATFSREGPGRTGVIARDSTASDKTQSGYAFWVNDRGVVGLTKILNNNWDTLYLGTMRHLSLDADNTLVLRVQGNRVSGFVNDMPVVTYVDRSPLPPGIWGGWIAAVPGRSSVMAHYSRMLIAG